MSLKTESCDRFLRPVLARQRSKRTRRHNPAIDCHAGWLAVWLAGTSKWDDEAEITKVSEMKLCCGRNFSKQGIIITEFS